MAFEKENLLINIEKVLDHMSIEKTGWTDAARHSSLKVRRKMAKERRKQKDLDMVKEGTRFSGGGKWALSGNPRRWRRITQDVEVQQKPKAMAGQAVGRSPVTTKQEDVARGAKTLAPKAKWEKKVLPQAEKKPSEQATAPKSSRIKGYSPAMPQQIRTHTGKVRSSAIVNSIKAQDSAISAVQQKEQENFGLIQNAMSKVPNDATQAIVAMYALSNEIKSKRVWNSEALGLMGKIQLFLTKGLRDFKNFSKKFPGLANKAWIKSLKEALETEQLVGNNVISTATPTEVHTDIPGFKIPNINEYFSQSEKISGGEKTLNPALLNKDINELLGIRGDHFIPSKKTPKNPGIGSRFVKYNFKFRLNELGSNASSDIEKLRIHMSQVLGVNAEASETRELGFGRTVEVVVPRKNLQPVALGDITNSGAFKKDTSEIPMIYGEGVDGKPIIKDLASMNHLFIGGSTRTGKTNFIHGLIMGLLSKKKPGDIKLTLMDFKDGAEFSMYEGVPHLDGAIVGDIPSGIAKLGSLVERVNRRNAFLKKYHCKNIDVYNRKVDETNKAKGTSFPKLPRNVIVIDEIGDLLGENHKVADQARPLLTALASKGSSVGLHLVLGTQTIKRETISGFIQNNILSRVAFLMGTPQDSVGALGPNVSHSASNLSGNQGDAYFVDRGAKKESVKGKGVEDLKPAIRFQAPFVDTESEKTSSFINSLVSQTAKQQEPTSKKGITRNLPKATKNYPEATEGHPDEDRWWDREGWN